LTICYEPNYDCGNFNDPAGRTAMSEASNATNEATQKPATVAVATSGRNGGAGKQSALDAAAALGVVQIPPDGAVVPVQADPTAELRALLTEALTVLTIYAEVAVPVVNYRGQPLSAHAPRELVERIHRAIGV
jgi:hypothetical protein